MTKTRSFWLSLLAVILIAWLFYGLAFRASRGGEQTPLYSVRRYDPYGAAGLYELLKERGADVRLLERPRIQTEARGVLIQVLPVPDKVPAFGTGVRLETDELKDFIARGNTVIQLTRRRTPLMTGLGVPAPAAQGRQAFQVGPLQTTVLFNQDEMAEGIEERQRKGEFPDKLPGDWVGATLIDQSHNMGDRDLQLAMRAPLAFKTVTDPNWTPIAQVAGHDVAGRYRYHQGDLIAIGAPSVVTNEGLTRSYNLEFILSLTGKRPIIIDEWSHGIGHGGTIIGLIRRFHLIPAILQILFVVALYIWSSRGHRRPDMLVPVRRRSSIEQVDALGYLYEKTMPFVQSRKQVGEEVVRRLSTALRCPPEDIKKHIERLPARLLRSGRLALDKLKAARQSTGGRSGHVHLANALTASNEFVKLLRSGRHHGR